jgi:hypothetical protein
MRSSLRNFLCLLALTGMTACSGGNAPSSTLPSLRTAQSVATVSSNTPPPMPTEDPCPVAVVQAPTIYVPAPGATNVPIAPGTLIIADTLAQFHTPYRAALTPVNGGPTIYTTLFAQLREVPFGGSGPRRIRLAAAQYPELGRGTTYEITFEHKATGCPITPPVAGFTTVGTRPTPTPSPSPTATPSPCTSATPALQSMISPADGATNVSPNSGPNSFILLKGPIASLTLQAPGGAPITVSTIDPLPLAFGEVAFFLPQLAPNTTYTVTALDTNGCTKVVLGSFTTGVGSTSTPPPTATPCGVATPPGQEMVSPADGATDVSPNGGPNSFILLKGPITRLTLQASGGPLIIVSTIDPIPVPFGEIAFFLPALAPNTTYAVAVFDSEGLCPSVPIGSFTTGSASAPPTPIESAVLPPR